MQCNLDFHYFSIVYIVSTDREGPDDALYDPICEMLVLVSETDLAIFSGITEIKF